MTKSEKREFGAEIKNKWEGQLIHPSIHYLWFVFLPCFFCANPFYRHLKPIFLISQHMLIFDNKSKVLSEIRTHILPRLYRCIIPQGHGALIILLCSLVLKKLLNPEPCYLFITLVPEHFTSTEQFFLMLALLKRTSFWPLSLVLLNLYEGHNTVHRHNF